MAVTPNVSVTRSRTGFGRPDCGRPARADHGGSHRARELVAAVGVQVPLVAHEAVAAARVRIGWSRARPAAGPGPRRSSTGRPLPPPALVALVDGDRRTVTVSVLGGMLLSVTRNATVRLPKVG